MPDLTWMFIIVVVCLAGAFVWMFCEFELYAERRRTRTAGPAPARADRVRAAVKTRRE